MCSNICMVNFLIVNSVNIFYHLKIWLYNAENNKKKVVWCIY